MTHLLRHQTISILQGIFQCIISLLNFIRASYDITKRKIDPPLEHWKKHCICKTPMNPDLLYVQCDKCDGWYHTQCIGISIEEAEAIDQYFCYICQNITGVSNISTVSMNNSYCDDVPIKKKKQKKTVTLVHLMKNQTNIDIASESFLKEVNKNASLKLSTHETISSDKEKTIASIEGNDMFLNRNSIFQRMSLKDFQLENMDDLFDSLPSEEEELPKNLGISKIQEEDKSDESSSKSDIGFPRKFNDDLWDNLDFQVEFDFVQQRDSTQNMFESLENDIFKGDFLFDPGKPLIQEAFITSDFGGITG